MAMFPSLSTGSVAQYPSSRTLLSRSTLLRFLDGSEQRFSLSRRPQHVWALDMNQIALDEANELATFFQEQAGEAGDFSFVDPWDNTTYPHCTFDQSTLELCAIEEGVYRCRVTIREKY